MEKNYGENSRVTDDGSILRSELPTPPTLPSWLQANLNQPFGIGSDDTSSACSTRRSTTSPSRPREIKRQSGSPRQAMRNTTSPLSSSLDRKRPADTTLLPTSMRMFSSEDDEMEEGTKTPKLTTLEFIEKECVHRGWTGQKGRGRPTNDPFKLLALCSTKDPWHSRSLHLIDPQQLSCLLENVYVTNEAMCHGLQFVPRKGDLIACGVYRSGLTPAMQVLASLKLGRVVDKQHLVDMTDWLEAAHPSHNPSFRRNDPGDRLIRTHMPLRTLFGGVITSSPRGTSPKFHVVVMMRDPADIRLSWFRHVRRVYRKFHRESHFDSHIRVDDFAGVHLYAANPNISSVTANHFDYENFVVECTKAALEDHNSHILLCFYEELLVNPQAFVQRIAEFTGLCLDRPELLEEIARTLVEDEDFPSTFAATPHDMQGLPPTASTISPTSIADDSSLDQAIPTKMIAVVESHQQLEHHNRHPRDHRKGCSGQGRLCFSRESLRKFDFKWRDIVLVASHSLTSYERLVLESSPIFRHLSPQGSVSSSASEFATKRSPRGSFLGMYRVGLPRIGSFTSFFKTSSSSPSKTPAHSSAAQAEGMSESADDTEVTTEEEHSESDIHAQHLAALFPGSGEDSVMPFPGTKPRSRTRTSSLLSLSSMFRETLNPPSVTGGGSLPSLAENHSASSRVTQHQHHSQQKIDPDDSGDEDELNMFLDVKKSRIYERRTYHHPVV